MLTTDILQSKKSMPPSHSMKENKRSNSIKWHPFKKKFRHPFRNSTPSTVCSSSMDGNSSNGVISERTTTNINKDTIIGDDCNKVCYSYNGLESLDKPMDSILFDKTKNISLTQAIEKSELKEIPNPTEYLITRKSLEEALCEIKLFHGSIHSEVAELHQNIGKFILQEEKDQSEVAIGHFKDALSIYLELYGGYQIEAARVLQCIGFAYFSSDEYEKSLPYLIASVPILRIEDPKTACDVYGKSLKCMYILQMRGYDLDEAFTSIKENNDDACEFMTNKNCAVIVQGYHELGCAYFQSGDYDRATECYNEELILKNILWGKGHWESGNTLTCLASTYNAAGMDDLAVEHYRLALKQTSNFNKPLILNMLGKIYWKKNRFGEALSCYKQALRMVNIDNDSNAVRILLLNNMGNVFFDCGMEDKAIKCYEEAKHLIGDADKNHSNANNSVAFMYHMLDLDNENDAHESKNKMPGNIHTVNKEIEGSSSKALNNIGNIYLKQGKLEEAVHSYQTSLHLKEKHFGKNSKEICGTLSNLGSAYFRMEYYELALDHFERAKCIMEDIMKIAISCNISNILEVAMILNNIGNVYGKIQDYDTALELYQKSLEMKQSILDGDHKGVLLTQQNIGLVMVKKGQSEEALELFKIIYEIKKEVMTETHPDVAKILMDMASAHIAMERYKTAKQFIKSAKTSFVKANLRESHPFMRQAKHIQRTLTSKCA